MKNRDHHKVTANQGQGGGTETMTIEVHDQLSRALQRCAWIIITETGRSRLDIMNEMVRDFLVKHGC